MLRWRLILGTAFVALLVLLCYGDAHAETPGVFLLPLAAVLAVLGSQEIIRLFDSARLANRPSIIYAGSLAMVLSAATVLRGPTLLGSLGAPALVFGLTLLAAFTVEIFRYEKPGGINSRLAHTLLGVAYVGWGMTFLVQLRLLPAAGDLGPHVNWGAWGMPALASCVAVVKATDTGAYAFGRLFGGRFFTRKLAPKLSPGKTIEGGIGGIASGVLASFLTLGWLYPPGGKSVDWPAWLIYGLVVGAAGMIADLAESLLKRDVGQKDSSSWLPGFGGVLDIMDSLLLASPVAYACFALGLFR